MSLTAVFNIVIGLLGGIALSISGWALVNQINLMTKVATLEGKQISDRELLSDRIDNNRLAVDQIRVSVGRIEELFRQYLEGRKHLGEPE